jgi:hypothetical protein
MAHFANIDENNIVINVIVVEQDYVDTGKLGDPSKWIQTSYNTAGGVHKLGETPLRKNYAGVGYTYDETRDAFIPPQPYPSWTLVEQTCHWESPVEYPPMTGQIYHWDESSLSWVATPNE